MDKSRKRIQFQINLLTEAVETLEVLESQNDTNRETILEGKAKIEALQWALTFI